MPLPQSVAQREKLIKYEWVTNNITTIIKIEHCTRVGKHLGMFHRNYFVQILIDCAVGRHHSKLWKQNMGDEKRTNKYCMVA